MTKYREILRLKSLGLSDRKIAVTSHVSRNTVAKVIARARELKLSWPLDDDDMTDADLEALMFPKISASFSERAAIPDYEYIRRELMRNGVTKKLLWTEYLAECRQKNEIPLMYSRFCHYIRKEEEKRNATMHIPRKPGQQIEVDWAGDPAFITDPDTGEMTKVWLFVGVLPYSQYTFVEGFMNEKQSNWIKAHVHMYEFFGGVTPILIPDNCTTAVNHSESDWYTVSLNRTYHEMAEHYNTAVLPARVRRPKDKASVEGSVGNISTWITAALRNEQFFSLAELNTAIKEKLRIFNANQFQKKEGSRQSLFLGEEKPLLAPLPAVPFESAEWKKATVQFNYHIAVDGMYYSVPYQYIKSKVDVRITETTIEIFSDHKRIASHSIRKGRAGQYSTVPQHMPEDHQKFLEWNGARFRKWAENIGTCTFEVIDSILTSSKIEQQSYRACMGLLKLEDKYSGPKLEAACKRVLTYTNAPSYKTVKNILVTMDNSPVSKSDVHDKNISIGITRGSKYYGGKR